MISPAGAPAMDFQMYISSIFSGSGIIQYSICAVVVLILARMEIARRSTKVKLSPRLLERGQDGILAKGKKAVQQFAPEIIGLAVVLALALALRMNGTLEQIVEAKGHPEVLNRVLRKWPVLLTADSLLSLQSMLRLLVLISSVLRAATGSLLISREVAAISCAAMLGRVALVIHSRTYLLDGPLGGYLPMTFDLVSASLLTILTTGINLKGLAATALALLAAAGIGATNYIKLADDHLADGLFIAVHSAEVFAAFAYLARALFSDVGIGSAGRRSVALWFAHVLMPVQASLSAYYFIEAFHTVPQIIGAGYPFAILHMGGVLQVAIYAGAAVLHFTPCEPKELAPLQLTQDLCQEPAGYGELQLSEQGLP